MAPPDTDAILVARHLAGDDAAFAEIYARHARHIAGVAFRIMGDDLEMDDVVQETFVDAAEGLQALREPDRLLGWLVVVAVRHARFRLRRRTVRRWLGLALERGAPVTSDPRDRAEVDALADLLGDLPHRLRAPWILHRVEGFSLPETARACAVSLATVKRRIAAAEERIRRRRHAR